MEQLSQGVAPGNPEQLSDSSLDVFRAPAEGEFDLFDDESPSPGNYLSQARELEKVHGVFNSNMLASQLDNGGERATMSPEEIRQLIDRSSETIVELARRAVLGTEANN